MAEKTSEDLSVLDTFRALLSLQLKVIDKILANVKRDVEADCYGQNRDKVRMVSSVILNQIKASVESTLLLSEVESLHIQACFGIARSITEASVNSCFVLASEAVVAEQAYAHALQRGHRSLNRSADIGGTRFSVASSGFVLAASEAEVSEAFDLYTTAKGAERTAWTTTSMSERVKKISSLSETAGIALGSAIFGIYGIASEFLHGTFSSATYFWSGSPSHTQFSATWDRHATTVLSSVYLALTACISCFEKKYELDELRGITVDMHKIIEEAIVRSGSGDGNPHHASIASVE